MTGCKLCAVYNDFFAMGQGLFTITPCSADLSTINPDPGKPAMASPEKVIRIDSLLAGLFEKRQWDRRLGLHAIFQNWPGVVGKEIARQAEPHVIRGTVLWVNVSDSVWMQQLHLQKLHLLEKINASLPGPEKISDVRFQVDAALGREEATPEAHKQAPPLQSIDPEALKDFERLVASIVDPETRSRLLSLWKKAHRFPSPAGGE
jgi:hypothetical protein